MKFKYIIAVIFILFSFTSVYSRDEIVTGGGNESPTSVYIQKPIVTGGNGESYQFDGVDDLIVVPDNVSLNPASMTISFEFTLHEGVSLKSGNNHSRQFMIFKKNPMPHFNEGISIYYDEEGRNVIATMSDLNRKQIYAYSKKGTIFHDSTYFITVTADSNELSLYLDTTLQKTNKSGFPLYFDKEPLLIGGRNNVILENEKYGGMLCGELRNIKIYSKSIPEIGKKYFFSGDSSLDTLLILNYSNYEKYGIVYDNAGLNNGIILKGRPSKAELREPDYVRISPNPAKGKTEVIFKVAELSNVKIVIRNLEGQDLITVQDGPLKKGDYRLPFYPETLKSGYYVCFVQVENELRTASFIVIN